MGFRCPACGGAAEVRRRFDGRAGVSCACGVRDVLDYAENDGVTFMEFCSRYDMGLVARTEGEALPGLAGGGADPDVRDPAEVEAMIRDLGADGATAGVLRTADDYVADYRVLGGPGPEEGGPPEGLGIAAPLAAALGRLGIRRLYRFQEEAFREIAAGRSVVIEAPTASGKTEAFLVPAIQRALGGPRRGIYALFVYPTKALARDQFQKVQRMTAGSGVRARVYDGYTSAGERREVLDDPPDILITNFDLLHHHMWNRTRLASLLGTVRMVVVDEVHQYTGIFGSNVYYIIKRLRRLCGGRLQFVAASATLGRPGEFCRGLFGEEMVEVRVPCRRGRTDFAMLFPVGRRQRGLMVDLAKTMTEKGHKTMVFSNSHQGSELLAIQARKRGMGIMVHRAGLTAEYRREAEERFKSGGLMAISCTPTLELGIDVGDVDCVISAVVPVNRLMQRIGRAARKGQRGYAFLALGNDPISQYYRNHPGDYFEDSEEAYIDPRNPFVEEVQVLAAACDRGISAGELEEHRGTVERLVLDGYLAESGGGAVPNPGKCMPRLKKYNIRGIGRTIDIMLDGRKVGDRAVAIAIEELHKDAVYLLKGGHYRVADMDHGPGGRAVLERLPPNYPYYTRALTTSTPTIEGEIGRRAAGGVDVAFCSLRIEKSVYGYANLELGGDAGPGQKVMLDEPLSYTLETKGIVFRAPRPSGAIAGAGEAEYEEGVQVAAGDAGYAMPEYVEASAYHAAEHVVIEGSNMIIGGASQDLGGISMGMSGVIYVHDGVVGGSGASRALYDRLEKAFARGGEIIRGCPCTSADGCPRCTYSYKCGNNNEFLHKLAALEVFERIAAGEQTEIAGHEGYAPLV